MSTIGDKPAFPTKSITVHKGMTYREWLIGQALTGYCARGDVTCKEKSILVIAAADEVLKKL